MSENEQKTEKSNEPAGAEGYSNNEKVDANSSGFQLPYPKNLVAVFLLFLVLAAVIYYFYSSEQEQLGKVKDGDLVLIVYSIFDHDGMILASTLLEQNSSFIHNPQMLRVNSSSSGVLGFVSKNIIGMKVGDEKVLNISKDSNIFGPYDHALAIEMPLVVNISMYDRFKKSDFLESTGIKEVEVNKTISTNGGYKITILGINDDDTIDIQYIMFPGSKIRTVLGLDAIVESTNRDSYTIRILPELSATLRLPNEVSRNLTWRVSKISNHSYTIDANDPLAGKDLIMWLRIENIIGKDILK